MLLLAYMSQLMPEELSTCPRPRLELILPEDDVTPAGERPSTEPRGRTGGQVTVVNPHAAELETQSELPERSVTRRQRCAGDV
jgi:hypothetical protein